MAGDQYPNVPAGDQVRVSALAASGEMADRLQELMILNSNQRADLEEALLEAKKFEGLMRDARVAYHKVKGDLRIAKDNNKICGADRGHLLKIIEDMRNSPSMNPVLVDTMRDVLHKALPVLWSERSRIQQEAYAQGFGASAHKILEQLCKDAESVLAEIKYQEEKMESNSSKDAVYKVPDSPEVKQAKAEQVARDDVDNRFTYHPPKAGQAERYVYLRNQAHNLAADILRNCPDSRERSLALTKLEEAVMWANASIARNE